MGNGYGSQQPPYIPREAMAANGYNSGGHYGQNYMSRAPVMGKVAFDILNHPYCNFLNQILVKTLNFLLPVAVPPHPTDRHALDLAGSREQRGSAFELYRKPQAGAVGHHHNLRYVCSTF